MRAMADLVHLRLVVPEACRQPVLDYFDRTDAMCNFTVLTDASRRPSGDVVELDVPREAINEVLDELEGLGLAEDGSITVTHSELTLSRFAEHVQEVSPGHPYDTVVWDEVSAKLHDAVHPTFAYLAFFAVGAVIAAGGVLADSPILIVGAMVVGPEYAPLAAMAAGLYDRDWSLLRKGAWCLAVGTALAIGVAFLVAVLARAVDQVPAAYALGQRPLTSFITNPDLFTVLIAAAAAVAGMLALTQDRAGTLVGVLISVTTIPAIAEVGVGIAFGRPGEVGGALAQLGINVTCIVVVGVATLAFLHRKRPPPHSDPHSASGVRPSGRRLGYVGRRHGTVPPRDGPD